jgi:multiple sugar transport system ATP-binding protein
MCEYAMPESLRAHAGDLGDRSIVAGVRPEHFEDVSIVGRQEQRAGARFEATVDVLEWLGSDLFVHFSVERGAVEARGLSEVADELQEAGVRHADEALTVARIDPASDIAAGDTIELWVDTARVHYFDAESGENVLDLDDEMPAVTEPVGAGATG